MSGGLELKLDTPDEETRCLEQTIKLYDADDEEGEASEAVIIGDNTTEAAVILTRIAGVVPEVRNIGTTHQDLVLKRKRPNSLNR